MKKKILLIGISGFIGRNLFDDLVKHNYEIEGTYFTPMSQIEKNNIKHFEEKSIKLYYLDFINQENYINIPWSDFNFIIICGAISRPMNIPLSRYFDVNSLGSLTLLEHINNHKGSKLEKVVYTSSVSVLGTSTDDKHLNEDDYQHTDDLYSLSKRYGEKIAMYFLKNKYLPIAIYRPCLTYGMHQDIRSVIYKFIRFNIFPLFNKDIKFEFLYVKNFTNLLIENLEKDKDIYNYFNITDGESYTLENLVDTVSRYYNRKYIKFYLPKKIGYLVGLISEKFFRINKKQPPFSRTAAEWMSKNTNIYSCEKAKKILDYKPKYNIETGIKETLNWLKNSERK